MSAGADLGVLRWLIDADDSGLDAKLNAAEAKVRAWSARMSNVTTQIGGGPGVGTFGGGPLNGANAVPWGASSPNWSQLLNQQAQQITAGFAGTQPLASPNWSYYFGQLGNQLSALQPTSSPNWSYLLNQGQQGGGGGPSTPTQRVVRGALIYHFGMQLGREALDAEGRAYEFGRVLSRGTLDEQVAAGVAEAKYYDREALGGLPGLLSRFAGAHPILSNFLVPGGAAINYLRGGTTEDIRNAVEDAAAAHAGQNAADAARRGTTRMSRRVGEIGMTAYQASISHAGDAYDEGMDEVRALRQQAQKLTGENNQTANALAAEADSREKVLGQIYGANLTTATRRRVGHAVGGGVLSGVRAFGQGLTGLAEMGAAAQAATGDEYGAQRSLTLAEYARQEAGAPNAVVRFALHAFHQAMLGGQDAIHQRELTERSEDLNVAAEQVTAQNPFLSDTAAYQIRRRVTQDKKALALARYRAQNPNDAAGAATLGRYYDSETDLLDAQASMQAQQSSIGASAQIEVNQQLLNRNSRAAAIAAIRGRTRQNVLAAGVDANGLPSMQAQAALVQGGQAIQLENQRQDDRERLIGMQISGQHDVLVALLGQTPGTAAMSPIGRGIVGNAIQQRVQGQIQAQQLLQQGNVLGAIGSLSNSVAGLDVLKQNLFQNVEARGVNLNLQDVSHPETSTEDLSKAIAEQRRLLMADLASQLPQIISDLIS